ncbi:MAG TPA: hypothetical protein VLX92_27720 [Kofleriaceae bacterium]|nr:hypothetical protein [Kofleriaceae bacterium]
MLRAALVLALCACHHTGSVAIDAPAIDAGLDAGDAAAGRACPTGSTLVVDRTSCPGAVVAPPAALLSISAQPGDVVSMSGLDEGDLPCVPALVCAPAGAATLLFSDDPESPSSDGVLYADTFGPGRARLYVYHVNGGSAPRKFPVVVLNQNASDAHVTIARAARGGPSSDYVDVGKAVAAAWMASTGQTVVTVPAGTRVVLDAELDGEHAATGELVHAIFDIDADAPVKLSIVSVLAGEDAAAITASLPLLPADGLHDRGTFPGADVWLAGAAGGEGASARHLRLGAGVTEPVLAGTDATTGAPAMLHGNYGVAYRLLVAAQAQLGVAASPRGGSWAGALGPTPLPSGTGGLASTSDAIWLATVPAGAGELALMSGGGSSLPVDVLVIAAQ